MYIHTHIYTHTHTYIHTHTHTHTHVHFEASVTVYQSTMPNTPGEDKVSKIISFHALKVYSGSTYIAPLILNLGPSSK
jgi:hypothetical protein